jgi:HSP90 family molecular chaperone
MSTNIVPITIKESPWQNLSSEIIIGKDILELLSSSMYVDPMTIYREYAQNAADSIDLARADGQLAADAGKVTIILDVPGRNVKIRDNGTGIAQADFADRLTAFGE